MKNEASFNMNNIWLNNGVTHIQHHTINIPVIICLFDLIEIHVLPYSSK